MGVDKVGVDEMGSRQSGTTPIDRRSINYIQTLISHVRFKTLVKFSFCLAQKSWLLAFILFLSLVLSLSLSLSFSYSRNR